MEETGEATIDLAYEVYEEFETEFWASLAANEPSDRLLSLAGDELAAELPAIIEDTDQPVGGTVRQSFSIEEVVLMDPVAERVLILGCTDETDVEWASGEPGSAYGIEAGMIYDSDAEEFYLVELYVRAPDEPCD